MKRFLVLFLLLLLPVLVWAEEIKRADGSVIHGTVVRAEPDGLVLQTDAGVEKVDFAMLAPEVQKRFHYDRNKAEEYRAKQVAAQQQAAAQQLATVKAQIAAQVAAVEQKQQAQQMSPEEVARRVLVERSVIFVSASIEQGTTKGVRAGLSVQTGRAAPTLLDKDTRTTTSLGEGFIYGLEGASGETWQGKIYPAGYYHYTTPLGEEDTLRAYALTAEDAVAHGADGRGPTVPSVDPAAQRQLPGHLRGGTLLDK